MHPLAKVIKARSLVETFSVGSDVGSRVGSDVGLKGGSAVGPMVGSKVGSVVGSLVGSRVGSLVISYAGSLVGSPVHLEFMSYKSIKMGNNCKVTKLVGVGEGWLSKRPGRMTLCNAFSSNRSVLSRLLVYILCRSYSTRHDI